MKMFNKNVLLALKLVLVLLTVQQINNVLCDDNSPRVKTPLGEIQGTYMKTSTGKKYESYLGIRYANPPIGELRFKNPEPVSPWIGSYNASNHGNECMYFVGVLKGSEDCLFLNIFKPSNKSKKDGTLLDVIVHIHGGAFSMLSSKFILTHNFMDYDIIYVTLNYRLGPIGFLSTGDKIVPGNMGLKDQSLALKWIKDNIKYFGGNPNKITITGVSAGGASVHYHYLSPMSRGLFNNGMATSGAALNPWAFAENVPEKTKIIASNLGCPTSDSSTMVKCLRQRPANQIVEQAPLFSKWRYLPFTPFGPVVEPEDVDSPFITRHPYDIIKSGDVAQVPFVCSLASEEGVLIADGIINDTELFQKLEDEWHVYAPHILDYNFTVGHPYDQQKNKITDMITNYYLKGKKITDSLKELIQMTGDRLFSASIIQSVLLQAAKSSAPVYLYRFGYRSKESNFAKLLYKTDLDLGVAHGEESLYYFGTEWLADIFNTTIPAPTKKDIEMRKRLINVHISLAKNGVPEFYDNIPLPAMKEALPKIKYLDIKRSGEAFVETKEELANEKFWSTVPLQEKLQILTHLKDEL